MNPVLTAAILWVFCAVAVAMMPMRWQIRLVPILGLAALAILGMITNIYGWLAGALALAGFVSMFRHPLRYAWRRLRGEKPEIPEEMKR